MREAWESQDARAAFMAGSVLLSDRAASPAGPDVHVDDGSAHARLSQQVANHLCDPRLASPDIRRRQQYLTQEPEFVSPIGENRHMPGARAVRDYDSH